MLEKSLAAMERLKQNPAIRDVRFRNLLDTEEECLEWHAWYDDAAGMECAGAAGYEKNGAVWRLDMIHIRRGSALDRVIERTTEAIIARLDLAISGTNETNGVRETHSASEARKVREAILRIKYDAPAGVKTSGIEVYYAVLELGLRTYNEFAAWKQVNPNVDLLGWKP